MIVELAVPGVIYTTVVLAGAAFRTLLFVNVPAAFDLLTLTMANAVTTMRAIRIIIFNFFIFLISKLLICAPIPAPVKELSRGALILV